MEGRQSWYRIDSLFSHPAYLCIPRAANDDRDGSKLGCCRLAADAQDLYFGGIRLDIRYAIQSTVQGSDGRPRAMNHDLLAYQAVELKVSDCKDMNGYRQSR